MSGQATCTFTSLLSTAGVTSSSPLNTEVPAMSANGSYRGTVCTPKTVKEEVSVLHCKNDLVTLETDTTACGVKGEAGGRLNQPITLSAASASLGLSSRTQSSFTRPSGHTALANHFDVPSMVNSPSFLAEKKEPWLFRNSPFNRNETASDGGSGQGESYPRMSLQGSSDSPLTDLSSNSCTIDNEFKMFPASKQLRLLSEKIKRQRGDSSFPVKQLKIADHAELSPASSEGASIFKALEFDSEAGSMNNSESPRQNSLLEDQPVPSVGEISTPSDSLPFIKIKIEVPDSDESVDNQGPLKKVKTEQKDDDNVMET